MPASNERFGASGTEGQRTENVKIENEMMSDKDIQ